MGGRPVPQGFSMKHSIASKFFAVVALLVIVFGLFGLFMAWRHVKRQAVEQLNGRADVMHLAERTFNEALNKEAKTGSALLITSIMRDFTARLETTNCPKLGYPSVSIVRFRLDPPALRRLAGPRGNEAIVALFGADAPATPSERRWLGRLTITSEPCLALVLPCAISAPGDAAPRMDLFAIPKSDLNRRFMGEVRRQATTGLGPFMLALICVCCAFHRIISRRVGEIADHFTALAANPEEPRQDPLPVRRDDEIGRISSSFNVLIGILRNSRERLDALVRQRTQEVERSYQDLKQQMNERHRAEEGLNRLVAVVDQAVEMIMLTDEAGVIEYVNPAFERVTGYKASEVVGRPIETMRSSRHDEAFYQKICHTVAAGGVWTGRVSKTRKDGDLYEQDTTVSPIRDADGRIDGFVSLGRDVSAEVALEQQFRQAQKMEAVGRLAGGIAHDFNNLLTVINGYGDLLAARLGREHPLAKDVAEIKRAGERAGSLTRQLLAFSRRQVLQPKVIDLNRLIADMENMLRRLIGEDIELVVSAAADLGKIMADPGQVEQVILNLAVNARDAMPGGGRIVLTTTNIDLDSGQYVSFSIADTGQGMSDETLAHIFEPFFTTKEMGKGTGLGLSTVYGIVKQSGGDIRVSSAPGRGSTFQVLFPRRASVQDDLARVDDAAAPAGGNETILLVEDDELVRTLVETLLQKAGYHVLTAADGIEGLDVFREHGERIELVMTDLVMPKLGGRGLVERLAAQYGPLRVLYMSGYSDEEVKRHGEIEPGSHFIGKPFAAREMLDQVRAVLKMDKSEIRIALSETNPNH